MAQKTTITILGAAGLIGRRHVDHVVRNPLTELHSIIDPTAAGIELGSQLKVPVYETLSDLFACCESERPHGAVIATPSHLHVQQAIDLIGHGIHVLIEKPVCTSTEEGAALIKAAEGPQAGTVLSGYHRRFNPYITSLKGMLASGKLGHILAVQGTWAVRKPSNYFAERAWRTQSGSGGTLLTNMSHEIDTFRYLFGDITRVYLELGPNTRGHDVDETGAATLRFSSGTVGTFLFSDAALSPFSFEGATGENPGLVPHSGANVYRVLGTRGSAELPEFHRYYWGGPGEGDWSNRLSVDDEFSAKQNEDTYRHTYENAPFSRRLEHWLRVIREGERPNCTAKDGVLATVVLNALRESGRSGVPVNISLEH